MRIALGGIMHESNTYSSFRTDRQRFIEGSWTHGVAMIDEWADAHHEIGGFIAAARQNSCELLPATMAWATPSGPVDDEILDEVVDEIIASCRSGNPDGLLLALHGAMVTSDHHDADCEVLRRIRAALGPELPIVVSLDYHGNISGEMAEYACALIGYQTYPHVDQRERGELAGELLIRAIRREIKPVTAVAKQPMIINLLAQETDREPMRSLMSRTRQMEKAENVLSISIVAGFPYADVPAKGPAVIVVTDDDRLAAQRIANELGQEMFELHDEMQTTRPGPEESVCEAMKSAQRPVLLVDLGDNIGGGSAGDGTILLDELLKKDARNWLAVLYSPEGVREAVHLGVGGTFDSSIGGAVDTHHGPPVSIKGRVDSIHDGKWIEPAARHGGRRINDQGPTAVISVEGGSWIVLNSLRTPPFSLGHLTSLGLALNKIDIFVVKAAIAYKSAYASLNATIIEVDTPGLTMLDPTRL